MPGELDKALSAAEARIDVLTQCGRLAAKRAEDFAKRVNSVLQSCNSAAFLRAIAVETEVEYREKLIQPQLEKKKLFVVDVTDPTTKLQHGDTQTSLILYRFTPELMMDLHNDHEISVTIADAVQRHLAQRKPAVTNDDSNSGWGCVSTAITIFVLVVVLLLLFAH